MKVKLFLISFLVISVAPLFAFGETAKIVTKNNFIREYCKFYAPVKASVRYDDLLEVISTNGDWFKVRVGEIEGCIHKSAIVRQRPIRPVLLGVDIEPTSEDEVALAGKGFNYEVEESYKNSHPEMNFSLLDLIENYEVDENKIIEFINHGKLKLPK